MGLSGISFWEVLVVFLVVFLLFGSKRLGTIGSDLGAAIRDFRRALADDAPDSAQTRSDPADAAAPAPPERPAQPGL